MSGLTVAEVRELKARYQAAQEADEAAMRVVMQPAYDAPKNERGQFLDPEAVELACKPFEAAAEAAQDHRLDLREHIEDLALELIDLLLSQADALAAAETREQTLREALEGMTEHFGRFTYYREPPKENHRAKAVWHIRCENCFNSSESPTAAAPPYLPVHFVDWPAEELRPALNLLVEHKAGCPVGPALAALASAPATQTEGRT